MDSLRPDRDELDQFKNRQNKSKPNTNSSAVSPSTVNVAPKTGGRVPSVPVKKNSPLVFLLVVVLLIVSSGLGWAYWQQQNELVELRKDLEDATGFIGQSKLLMARLEGELSETGAELEQSGSAATKKLAFLDSEMRKLWGVSNDRNKTAIKANEDGLSVTKAQLQQLSKKLESTATSNKALRAVMEGGTKKLEGSLTSLDGRLSLLANEVSITRADQEDSLSVVQRSLKDLRDLTVNAGKQAKLSLGEHASRIDSSEESIASINASRRQLNERVVALERMLGELQISLKGVSKAKDVQ